MTRTIAIGDVHGCAKAFSSLVDLVAPEPDDLVITLGDYINRGPDSRGVISQLIEMRHRCRLVSILGNHDEMLLQCLEGHAEIDDFLAMGGKPTLDSYGFADLPMHQPALPEDHLAFLKDCRDFHETESHLFMHAAYLAIMPMCRQPGFVLRWGSLRQYVPEPHYSGKRAIVGHTSQKSGEILDLGHLVCIDTYCYGGGWLTALDVVTGTLWQVNRDGEPRSFRSNQE